MKIICDWENCKELGSYKAPVEKDNSKKYRLLCLKHIKIFNKSWNYFENMNNQEIEYFIKSDLTWHKSTKKFGSSDNFFNILWNNALEDKLNIFNNSNFKDFKKTKVSQTDKDALQVMDLNDEVKWEQIQSKFKELVKKYHPDKKKDAKNISEKLKSKKYTVKKLSTENNELYGSVKPTEISKIILDNDKIDIKPSLIQLTNDIKSLGEFKVLINLHSEVQVQIIIKVVAAETIQ